eukprot:84231-Chlamydomonas_euryale.AAC.1
MHSLAFACPAGTPVSTADAVACMTSATDPVTLAEALSGGNADDWLLAIDDEMNNLIGMDVYEIVDKPPGVKLIPVKWVFKTKYDAFGTLEKYTCSPSCAFSVPF